MLIAFLTSKAVYIPLLGSLITTLLLTVLLPNSRLIAILHLLNILLTSFSIVLALSTTIQVNLQATILLISGLLLLSSHL